MDAARPPAAGHDAWCRALEARWHEEIPISAAMGIAVEAFDGAGLRVRAGLAPNVNVHGTVFAGSLFSLASLCGWGLVYLKLLERGQAASIVFVEGRLRCDQPARTDISAAAAWTSAAEWALAALSREGRCRIVLDVDVEAGGRIVSAFNGEYAVRAAPQ